MCATHLTNVTLCSTCNNCDICVIASLSYTVTSIWHIWQRVHSVRSWCWSRHWLHSNHKCWQTKSPQYQRKENFPLELKISETPRCRITSWCKQYQPACVWLFSTPCVCLTQTISAGLPPAPLLVDIISLFTKLTIARAGWSRSSSANTWHWKCVSF